MTPRRKLFLMAALSSLVSLLVHLRDVAAAEIQVSGEAGKFQPNVITIKAGDTVRFHLGDTSLCRLLVAGADGTLTAPPPQISGPDAVRIFLRPGHFRAKCAGSDEWSLTIIVRPQVAG
jgi:plastocyanin